MHTEADINWSNIDNYMGTVWTNSTLYPEYGSTPSLVTLFTGSPKDIFVRADLIDFAEEFDYLRDLSQELAEIGTTGTIIESEEPLIVTNGEYGNAKNRAIPGVILRGRNPFYNVFNVTSEKWNSYENILFDVPYDSYVIININGIE